MTDRKLLEKAAKAAGMRLIGFVNEMIVQPDHRAGGFIIRNERGGDSSWNPLTDDGDALRLAVKMRLRVCTPTTDLDCAIASNGDVTKYSQDDVEGELMRDLYAATRRAIVRAAAAIGETM